MKDTESTGNRPTEEATSPQPSHDRSREIEQPPGPDGYPLVGNTIGTLRDGVEFINDLQEYGDVVQYTALGEAFVTVFDPELVESVLVSRNDEFWKGSFEEEFGELLAPNGLVFTSETQWDDQRALLQPLFTPERLQTYTESIQAASATAVDEWRAAETIDLREACSELTLSILADTLFTIDLTTERGAIVRAAVAAINERTDITSMAHLLPDWAPRTPTQRRFDRAMADLDRLIATLIDERNHTDADHDDLLAALLSADDAVMDDETVRDQLVTFLFAGHETTALALTYTLWLLSGHESVCEQLVTALDTDSGSSEQPTACSVPALTDHVIREALRLYPPIYVLHREPKHDLTLGGYRIPRGTTLQLPAYTIHRDPRWWDTPDAVVPDRWADTTSRPEYAYFPFGGGPRHCIGMRFAMLELKLVFSTLVRHLAFERVTDEFSPTPRALLTPGEVTLRVDGRGE